MAKYGITGKLMNKGDLMGFFVIDSNGKSFLFSMDKIIQLAKDNNITNWEAVYDEDGEGHIYSHDLSICNIDNNIKDKETEISIVGKIKKDNKLVGYICIDSDNNKHNYSCEKVWNLVELGRVPGAKAMQNKGKRVILTEGNKLRSLPEYSM